MRKKTICIALTAICAIATATSACAAKFDLTAYVSDLRKAVYCGESDSYSLKATSGYREKPFVNDGKAGTRVSYLKFKLMNAEYSETSYAVKMQYNQTEYTETFALDAISASLTAVLEIPDFNEHSFSVMISGANEAEQITLTNEVPQGALTSENAVNCLYANQKTLIDGYRTENGDFAAEIYLRIMVKNERPYWYVGIADGNKVTALLLDGIDGSVLAVREIF